MKKRKATVPRGKKKAPKATEWEVFKFSAVLEEYMQREDSKRDDRKEAEGPEREGDDRQEEATKSSPALTKKNDSRQLQ